MTVHGRDQGGTHAADSVFGVRKVSETLRGGAQAPDPSLRREVGTLDFDFEGLVSLGLELWLKATGEGGVSKEKFFSAHLSHTYVWPEPVRHRSAKSPKAPRVESLAGVFG